jgi:hypothetical protein
MSRRERSSGQNQTVDDAANFAAEPFRLLRSVGRSRVNESQQDWPTKRFPAVKAPEDHLVSDPSRLLHVRRTAMNTAVCLRLHSVPGIPTTARALLGGGGVSTTVRRHGSGIGF